MSILEDLKKIDVTYDDDDDSRWVKCFCGEVSKASLIPHLKREHPEKWELWRLDFVRLKNQGWSYKRIMWKYRAIFSWSVIDREIRKVVQEGKATLKPINKKGVIQLNPDFSLQKTTIWDFKKRGDWAVHTSDYRGNWPPQIPRNLILKYTCEGDLVLDPFVGGGTTLIEAYLLHRGSIGMDLNPQAIVFCNDKIAELEDKAENRLSLSLDCRPIIIEEDANNCIKLLKDLGFGEESVDLICAHPPYMDSIIYTNKEADLSRIKDVDEYCGRMAEIAGKLLVLLKEGGICGILVGDIRKGTRIVPLGFRVMNEFLQEGFKAREIIVKIQHQDKSTGFYESKDIAHCLLRHEYLFILEK